MSSVPIGALSFLETWLEPPRPSLDELAARYVDACRRLRPRPMAVPTRYRFPRGRRTDRVPMSAALAIARGSTGAMG